ncbi:hypothetical protein A1D30_10345 [Acidovorax sp. GW101-3H11]|nr:hypothetical protein A1D30_10345 [Acidovorax sp. GW101-3H11]
MQFDFCGFPRLQKAGVGTEFTWMLRQPVLVRIGGACKQRWAYGADGTGLQAGIGKFANAHRQINAFFDDVDVAVAELDIQLQMFVLEQVLGYQRKQHDFAECG